MLTGKQKRQLRGLGHNLKPVIMVGKGEVNEGLIKETIEVLAVHELIKVKLLESCAMDRHEVAENLAAACGADVGRVQRAGPQIVPHGSRRGANVRHC